MGHTIDFAAIVDPAPRASMDARPEGASDSQSDRFSAVEVACAALFERWCARRNVVPLAYLMHVWPIPKPTELDIRQLGGSMTELLRGHASALDAEDKKLIKRTLLSVQAALHV
ncbi:hypothetical protein PUN4_700076 [Paraburkholderia unamae]|uniref:hypothetical protein n=1 Tax=Paraburkholderia unamae TaxID=219649 RepID=UPI001CB139FD|nr:hypothetical protein [Paraburkholderia unamae]CAG9272565.1 hypothetical protein PUN4_700076 [Paraburkholderia unamae]